MTTEQPTSIAELVRHLNQPMLDRLRAVAERFGDTRETALISPVEARQLVCLIDQIAEATKAAVPAQELMAKLLGTSIAATQETSYRRVGRLRDQLADERARNNLIVKEISQLLNGEYMPTPSRLMQALWPSPEAIAKERAKERESRP